MWLVQPSGKGMSQPIIRQSGTPKEIAGIGQPAIKKALPKKCYSCKKL